MFFLFPSFMFLFCVLHLICAGGGGGGGLVYAKEGSSICVCAQYLQGADVSYIRVMDPPCLGSIPVIDGHGCNSTFALITMSTSLTLLSCWLNIAVVSVMQISEGGYVHHPCCFRLIKGHKIPWDFILCEGHVETYKNSYRSYLLHCFQFSSNCNVVFSCGWLESSSFTGYYCTRCKTGKTKTLLQF